MKLITTAVLLGFPLCLNAWDDHARLTHSALSPLTALSSVTASPTSFEKVALDLGYSSPLQFNQALQLNKGYRFEFKLGEKEGTPVAAIDVLSKYSDEPDWGMDKNLFTSDQYPELWRDEYAKMGGKETGTPSQAFRHMYWTRLSFFHPLRTFKLPLSKAFESMGQAPERAKIFIDLSRRAREKGHLYWSLRFIANAFHYLEDCAQPFHTAQTPTPAFLLLPFGKFGNGFSSFVTQMTRIITYYHFSFEWYVSTLIKAGLEGGPSAAEGKKLIGFLQSPDFRSESLSYTSLNAADEVISMAELSIAAADRAGKKSLDFFPPLTESYATLDVLNFMNASWAEQTLQKGRNESDEKKEFFRVLEEVFQPMGYALRQLTLAEVLKSPLGHEPTPVLK